MAENPLAGHCLARHPSTTCVGRSPLMASMPAASAAQALMRSAWVRGRVRKLEKVPEISLDFSRRRKS